MTCSTIFNLIVVGGFGTAITAGVMTETLLAKAGYKPKNYLAQWRNCAQAASSLSVKL